MNKQPALLIIAEILIAFASGLIVAGRAPGATMPMLLIVTIVAVVLIMESFNLWPKTSSSMVRRKAKKLPISKVSRAKK
jgi:hypothetical protein